MTAKDASAREIVITRDFDAPREFVFTAWTDPKHLEAWWGPKGFRNTFHQIEVKPGGVWRFIMHSPDGDDYNNKIVYSEVTRPERLVYSHGSDEEPDQFQVTVNLAAKDTGTSLTLRMLYPTASACEESKRFGAVEGGKQTLARLAAHLANTTN